MWLPADLWPVVVLGASSRHVQHCCRLGDVVAVNRRVDYSSSVAPLLADSSGYSWRHVHLRQGGARPGEVGRGPAPLQHSKRGVRRGR